MQGENFEKDSYLNSTSSDEECIVEHKNIFARALDDTTRVLTVFFMVEIIVTLLQSFAK